VTQNPSSGRVRESQGNEPPSHFRSITLDPHSAKVLYATGSVSLAARPGGVFKSLDGGKTWRKLGLRNNPASAVTVDPTNKAIMYVGAYTDEGYTVFKSVDSGQTWIMADPDYFEETEAYDMTIAVDPKAPSMVYGGFGMNLPHGGLYKSDDGGASWKRLLTGSVRQVALDASDPTVVYCRRHYYDRAKWEEIYGLLQSTDGGQNWQVLREDTWWFQLGPKGRVIYAAGYKKLPDASLDGGRTWQELSRTGLPEPDGFASLGSFVVEPNTAYRYLDWSGFLYRSRDSGRTWARVYVDRKYIEKDVLDAESPTGHSVKREYVGEGYTGNLVAFDPRDGTLYFLGLPHGAIGRKTIYASKDHGDTWTKVYSP